MLFDFESVDPSVSLREPPPLGRGGKKLSLNTEFLAPLLRGREPRSGEGVKFSDTLGGESTFLTPN